MGTNGNGSQEDKASEVDKDLVPVLEHVGAECRAIVKDLLTLENVVQRACRDIAKQLLLLEEVVKRAMAKVENK